MDLYSAVNAALCGFFGFAAIHYLLQWWLSRAERLLLVFGLFCAACSLFCLPIILLPHATTVQQAQLALTMRGTIGLLADALVPIFLALVGGRRVRIVMPAAMVLLIGAVLHLFVPLSGTVVALQLVSPTRSAPIVRDGHAWLLTILYGTIFVGYAYGLFVARAMWAKDRAGSILVGMGAMANLVTGGIIAPLIDFAHIQARYVGALPDAFFVLTMAMFLAREYGARGARLVASERLFSSAFEYAPIGMAIVGRDGAFLKVNRALCQITGFAEPELRLLKWEDITCPDDLRNDLDQFKRPVSDRTDTHQTEVRFIHKDGHVLWAFRSASMIRDDSGQALYALFQIQDVSQRRQAELALRESEERFRAMFERSGSGMALLDTDGRPLECNPALQAILGYSEKELCAMKFTEFTHPEDAASDWSLYQELLAGRRTAYELEKRYIMKDGRTIWGQLIVTLVRDEAGAAKYAVGMVQDITVRRKAEDALKESERRFATVFRESPVALVVAEWSTEKLIAVNPEFLRLYGATSADQVLGKSTTELGMWTSEVRRERLTKPLSVSGLVQGAVATVRRFNGETRAIEFWASSYDIDGKEHLLVSSIDVTDRERAQNELQDSLAQMRTLTGRLMRAQDDERRRIAQMLHETTAQDLAGLKMYLARLARTGTGLSDGDRATLSESIELAERSMSDIRTLSYLLHPPFLDEAGLLSALRWYAAGFSKRSGIAMDLDLPSTLERLPQETETVLFRAVQEALINIHHHAESPTASIRLRVDGHRLTLEIGDRGRGMRVEVMAQLPTGGAALGVGVTGMRERLQQLGGTLEIESSASGTTVRAQLPLPATVP